MVIPVFSSNRTRDIYLVNEVHENPIGIPLTQATHVHILMDFRVAGSRLETCGWNVTDPGSVVYDQMAVGADPGSGTTGQCLGAKIPVSDSGTFTADLDLAPFLSPGCSVTVIPIFGHCDVDFTASDPGVGSGVFCGIYNPTLSRHQVGHGWREWDDTGTKKWESIWYMTTDPTLYSGTGYYRGEVGASPFVSCPAMVTSRSFEVGAYPVFSSPGWHNTQGVVYHDKDGASAHWVTHWDSNSSSGYNSQADFTQCYHGRPTGYDIGAEGGHVRFDVVNVAGSGTITGVLTAVSISVTKSGYYPKMYPGRKTWQTLHL